MNADSGKMLDSQKLLTPHEVMAWLVISRATLYRLIDQRDFAFMKVGGQLRFVADDIRDYLERKRIESATGWK